MNKLTCGLIQLELNQESACTPEQLSNQLLDAHLPLIEQAGELGVQVLCLQEMFSLAHVQTKQDSNQNSNWCTVAERIPGGRTVQLMQQYARKYRMVIVAPIFEHELPDNYYSSAAVIDADGTYLGKYRKHPVPQAASRLTQEGDKEAYLEERQEIGQAPSFTPGNSGYPVFDTAYCKLGVYICHDRHFPEDWQALALNGAQYIVNPSATCAANSNYLWQLEHRAAAKANGIFVGAINRVVKESPWDDLPGDTFCNTYGASYIVNPLGQLEAQANNQQDELLVHEIDLDQIKAVRNRWQRLHDTRAESHNEQTWLRSAQFFNQAFNLC
ncbi:MAG: nitrilase-related carbon-nitrogen hydrolase [Amphritea sp.]